MSFRDWYKKQFAETLSDPLTESDGIHSPEIDSLLNGREVPLALHDYYRVAGRHSLDEFELRSITATERTALRVFVYHFHGREPECRTLGI